MKNIEIAKLLDNVVKAIGKDNEEAQIALDKYVGAVGLGFEKTDADWATTVRKITEKTEAETTRLLATKFVADEAVGLVRELVGALDEIVDVASEIHPPGDPRTAGVWVATIGAARETLAKAAQFTAAPTAPTVGGATETQIFPPVDEVPEYVPDWSRVLPGFHRVAVDQSGLVFAYVCMPERRTVSWVLPEECPQSDADCYLFEKIPPPPGDAWERMIYQRPKQ